MTQPTAGLGATVPSPRRASAIADRMNPVSAGLKGDGADAEGGIGLSGRIRGLQGSSGDFGLEGADELVEVRGFPEVLIDGRITDIGDLVQVEQGVHHHLTD